MVDKKITDFSSIPATADLDVVAIVDVSDTSEDVAGSSFKATMATFLAHYDALSATLTNKTFDANDSGNSITNIENADIAAAAAIVGTKLVEATSSARGAVELAIPSEVTTGTAANRAITPDALAGSDVMGGRGIQVRVFDVTTDVATGDKKATFRVDQRLAGMNIVDVHAEVDTAGTTNTLDVQLRNVTQAADILSTKLTVDSGETGSDTAATAAVIDTAQDDLTLHDVIAIDVDAIHTTAAKGLLITIGCRLP